MSRHSLLRGVSAGALYFGVAMAAASAQVPLPTIDVRSASRPAAADATIPSRTDADAAPGFGAQRAKLPVYRDPPGQTVTKVDHKFLETTPLVTVQEILRYSPGVTFQENGTPGNFVINIRGSGNRLNVTTRNIQMYEDGFPIMTADGNARTDMLDPHSFSGVDVYRGPSSALFGNHAYGGAINFRSFSGGEIDGVQTGSQFGSFGYFKNYLRAGKKVRDNVFGEAEASITASDQRSDGYIAHTASNIQNANFLLKWSPTPNDRLFLKLIYGSSFGEIQNRLSYSMYSWNAYLKNFGCSIATAFNTPFCNNLSQFRNGLYGATIRQSPDQFGTHWHILREIAGVRWEHDIDNNTTVRTQFTYDYLNNISATAIPPKFIGGPGGPVASNGPAVGIAASTDITNHGSLFGFPATHWLGFFYDNLKSTHPSYSQIPNIWNYGLRGGPTGKVDSYHSDLGLRAREEIALTKDLTAVIGFSSNWNRVWGVNTVYNFSFTGALQRPLEVAADRAYWNTAPEASLTWRYSPEWQFRARYAAGYGTPNFTNLTTTVNGAGNNTAMKAQTNMGVDLGVDWTPTKDVTISVTGYHEWFRNEIMQLTSPQVMVYFLNIPKSVHRGVEANIDWRPFEGARFLLAYNYNNQRSVEFMDPLSARVSYDRAGKAIPNVAPHSLTARAGYDIPFGSFAGLGGFVEYIYKSDYPLDNGNILWAPGYGLVNLNVHYSRDIADFYLKNVELFFETRNVANRRYVAGAVAMSDVLIGNTAVQQNAAMLSTSTGPGIIAGEPRSFIGGVKFKF